MAMKGREFVRILKAHGAVLIRQKGSHQTWVSPSGEPFTVVINNPGDEMNLNYWRKTLKNANMEWVNG